MSLNPNIDQGYIDKSWEDMRRILDNELPEKKNNRKWFLFFLGAALLSLLVWGITSYSYKDNSTIATSTYNNIDQVDVQKENPAASVQLDHTQDNTVAIAETVERDINPPSETVAASPIMESREGASTNNVFTKTPLAINKGNSTSGDESITPAPSKINPSNTWVDDKLMALDHIDIPSELLSNNYAPLVLTELSIPVQNFIKGDDRSVPELSMQINPLIAKAPQINPWTFGVGAIGSYSTKERYIGVGGLGKVGYSLNNNFGLSLGGGFTRWSKDGTTLEATELVAPGSGSIGEMVNSITIYPITKWDVHGSLGVFYKVFPFLTLEAGTRTRYDFQRSYENENVLSADAADIGLEDDEFLKMSIYQQDRTNPFINPFVGMEVKLFSRLSLNTQVEFKRKKADPQSAKPVIFSGALSYTF